MRRKRRRERRSRRGIPYTSCNASGKSVSLLSVPSVPLWLSLFARSEAQVSGGSGRHVDENALAVHLILADVRGHNFSHAAQPLPFAASDERRFQLADQRVLEEAP